MRFTIITPTLNRRALLEEALDSVVRQGHAVEHIVVDGGSTDGTLEMLAQRPEVTVISDRRRGLYDAINLGIERSSGAVIGLLNSDDLYAPGALSAVEKVLDDNPGADAACGRAELFDESGLVTRYDDPHDMVIDAHAALIGACIPNARFFRRTVFERVGLFSLRYPHVADRDFLSRTLIAGLRTTPVDALVYRYRRHDDSLTFAAGAERSEALRRELLQLAQDLSRRPDLPLDLKRKARALEGRCRAILALARLRQGDLKGALELLFLTSGRLSQAPLAAVAAAAADRLSGSR